MATLDSVFILEGGAATNLTVGAGASSAAQATSQNRLFAIIADGDFHIVFGDSSSLADAAATAIRIPANSFSRFDSGTHTHFKVYNPGSASITVQWIPLVRN